ncbi:MAG: NBR1-Ig-like domain-containing protein [Candidatus Promineifilaceae bacterium]|jgi:hypothetical protein
MKAKYLAQITLLILTLWALGACNQVTETTPTSLPPTTAATAEPTQSSEPLISAAEIDSLEILTEEQTADQVPVKLRGVFPDTCSRLDDITVERDGDTFNLMVQIIQEAGEECSQEAVPFEETVILDVAGLDAQSYNVIANNRQVSFELGAGEEPEPTATAEPTEEVEPTTTAAPVTASISGLVWHDSCANNAVEDTTPPAGCVLTEENLFLADGELGDEDGIAGVEIGLGAGECPATALDSTRTDEQGAFTFSDLSAGTYCLFIDMTRLQNQSILGAGSWTAPDGGDPQFTITLGEGQDQDGFNFGWDFLNLPAEAAEQIDCDNSFEFVSDLNIPDDTNFAPGEPFTKSWQLRNNGTCTWTTAYSILFVGGDQMSVDENIPLEQTVEPGEELEVSIDMVAPEETGTYRGNWQVADANGEPFGIDGFIEDAFWLQIVVAEDAATPLPNSAAIGGVVWDDFCLNSEPGQGCVEFPEDSGIFIADGTFGPAESPLSGILIGLAEGACPADGTVPGESAVLSTTLTGDDGRFIFEDLSEGTYCVFMDALNEEMIDLLIPGNWTWPATGVGQYSIALDPGEQILDLDFGWDYVD